MNNRVNFFTFFIIFLVPTFFVVYANFSHKGALKIIFFDIGQGTAIFIQTPSGKKILVDAGPNREVLRKLGKEMNFWDKNIDLLIASHPDSDHIGGFPEIVRKYKFDYFLKNKNISQTSYFKEMEERLIGKRVFHPKMGDKIHLDEDIYILVLFPDIDTQEFEANTSSIVFKLVYQRKEDELSLLFTGDSPAKIEKYLLTLFGDQLKSDILVVGHHGSKTSTSEIFLKTVNPEYSVITVGRDNRFGHPHDTVIEKLEKWGGEIFRTDTMGDVKFIIDEESVKVNN